MESVRFGLAIAMFLGASVSDLQIRRVRDRYWVPFLAAAAILLAIDWMEGNGNGMALVIAFGATAFFFALWWLGLFGGADAKGLMVLSWLWPASPDLLAGRTTPALDALLNGSIAVMLLPVAFLAFGLVRGQIRLPHAFLGIRVSKAWARGRHLWPLQDAAGRNRWFHKPGDTVEWHRLPSRIWVTPKVPFMVPLLLGLVAAWRGNVLLLWLVS